MTTGLVEESLSEIRFPCPDSVYNEVYAQGNQPRGQWQALLKSLSSLKRQDFARRNQQANRQLKENGVTFNVFSDHATSSRLWNLDLIPCMQDEKEWAELQAGLNQRATILNQVILDLYGEQQLIRRQILPRELIFANPAYLRPFCGLRPASADSHPLFLYAAELGRSPSGHWWVMADRSEAPAGAGFALENRIVTARSLPGIIQQIGVHRLAPFFLNLRESLVRKAGRDPDNARVVILTSGPSHPYYFEDVYLARYLGYLLVEGGDLAVRDDQVFLKTLSGLLPVDVILSRGTESGIDPLELGGGASHGIPGLLQAIRRGNVVVTNHPGCGLVEAPVFMAFLPQLCRHFLSEDLKLPSIATWWCGDPDSKALVLDRLESLVIKPAFVHSGGREIFVDQLTADERARLLHDIEAEPYRFIAQECIRRSAVPVWTEDGIECGHVAMRTFLVESAGQYELMPGGLIRIAPDAAPMALSVSAGISSKDLWVCGRDVEESVSLLLPTDQPAVLKRTSAMFPSRVADNLFWLGLSIERCDVLCRQIRGIADRLLNDDQTDLPEIRMLARALADQGQLEPGFVVDGLGSGLPGLVEALPAAVFDRDESGGLCAAVSEVARLTSLVRDWLSPDTLRRSLFATEEFMSTASASWYDLSDVISVTNDLIGNLAAVSGLITDGMIRGPSWLFLDFGRCMERARGNARLILSASESGGLASEANLRTLLEILDSQMTYRTRYRNQLQPNAVLDLLVTDETNPRSLAFLVSQMVHHVGQLPDREPTPLRSVENQLVMHSAHMVRMITGEQLAQRPPMHIRRVLQDVLKNLEQLSEALTRKYLVHSMAPRQINEFPGVVL
ncbi:MAG: circularly permuted type 2 ATP-grasp protein [Planctomycetaceae bacterium]